MELTGAGNRSRTCDLRITNALLYQLSYTGNGAGTTGSKNRKCDARRQDAVIQPSAFSAAPVRFSPQKKGEAGASPKRCWP